jgi:hypothetical protein
MKEIEQNLESIVSNPKNNHVKSFAEINGKHFDYNGYFIAKQE